MADDYAKRLHIGQVECETLAQDVAGAYMSLKSAGSSRPNFQTCEYLNVSICPATEEGNVSWQQTFGYIDIVLHVYMYIVCCLLYTSPSPRDATLSRMPSSA